MFEQPKGGDLSMRNSARVVGYDELGRPVVSKPSGLERQDLEETLRHRYLGVFGDRPEDHFLGGSDDITFGGDAGEIGRRWRRLAARGEPRETRLWQNAYREIGRISSWLELPSYIREEMTRIYANAKEQGTVQRTSLKKQLTKITWLACLIHRYPRPKEDINRGLRELYGHGIGKIPEEFVKAANYRNIRFGINSKDRRKYLQSWEMINGTRTNFRQIGPL
jgi:hypothetical protein